MLAAINAGLDQGVFGLTEGDDPKGSGAYEFRFNAYNGYAEASDSGHGEIWINATLHYVGRPVAKVSGWLERRTGKYLMDDESGNGVSLSRFNPAHAENFAQTQVKPCGYEAAGKFVI